MTRETLPDPLRESIKPLSDIVCRVAGGFAGEFTFSWVPDLGRRQLVEKVWTYRNGEKSIWKEKGDKVVAIYTVIFKLL
jgi:hypothetical protein